MYTKAASLEALHLSTVDTCGFKANITIHIYSSICLFVCICSPTFRLSRAVQLSIVLPNNLPHKVVVENEPILILCIEKRISDGFAHFRYYIVI